MTLGLSLALTLGAGLHADSGPSVVRRRFEAAWGKTEVFVANATAWDLTRVRAWRQEDTWSIQYARSFALPYRLRLEGANRHLYGDMRMHRAGHALAYGDLHQARVRHLDLYTDLGACRKSMSSPYWLTRRTSARHVAGYAVTEVDPVAQRHTAAWSLLDDARLQAVVNTPELGWNGRTVRIVSATLSCDEDSPVWIARVEVAALADFAAIGIGDAITLTLGLETFALVVDGKTLSRESVADRRCELTAVSPLALLDAPFAGTIQLYEPGAVSARDAVESLIGPVTWALPDWIIPAGRLMLENVTPLAAARNIVAAIGGIVESHPDGTVQCRRRHPVSIPDYGHAAVAHGLFDADVISASAQIAPSRGYDRVTIANEEGASDASADRVEYLADEDDAYRGTVRAWLALERTVLLIHTGHPATVIASQGSVSRMETETVEFVEGRGSARYPVAGIVATSWQHTDLGAVTADGQELIATTPGYSLLKVTYTTTSLDWRVALAADEEVQFMLVDE
jgi:hypothetical protein